MKQLLVMVCLVSSSICATSIEYDAFALSDADIQATLRKEVSCRLPEDKRMLAGISFGCADIKYSDGSVKFCECGDGICMSLRPAWVEINGKPEWLTAPYWGLFWHYVAQFKRPLWFIGDADPKTAFAMDVFESFGGTRYRTLQEFALDPKVKAYNKSLIKKSRSIADYRGIVVYRSVSDRDSASFRDFKRKYSAFLFVNDAIISHVKNKVLTYQAFIDAGLQANVPHSKYCSAVYSPSLVTSIKSAIATDYVVIKPENSSLAYGINVIHKDDLDAFLRIILKDKRTIPTKAHRGLLYWKQMHDKTFVAQEYIPSKSIIKDGKEYDPTMRIVYFMHHDRGVIKVTVIGGFWKIPVKSLHDARVTLTEKHVTIAHSGAYYTGMLCEHNDWVSIQTELERVLPQFYYSMMKRFYC